MFANIYIIHFPLVRRQNPIIFAFIKNKIRTFKKFLGQILSKRFFNLVQFKLLSYRTRYGVY